MGTLLTFLCWFVLLTAALRLVLPARARIRHVYVPIVLPQLPTTFGEWLVSPIPLASELEQATTDEGSAATIMNGAAARLHMLDAPLHPSVLALHAND